MGLEGHVLLGLPGRDGLKGRQVPVPVPLEVPKLRFPQSGSSGMAALGGSHDGPPEENSLLDGS
jgi:hypothetical protein